MSRASSSDGQTLLDKIARVSPIALIVTREADGHVLLANDRLAALLGLSVPDVLGRRAADFFADPADGERMLRELPDDDQLGDHEVLLRHSDGHTFWTLASRVRTEIGGERVVLCGIHDVDEHKRIEETFHLYKEIFTNSSDAITVISPRGEVVARNPAHERFTGFPDHAILGHEPGAFMGAENQRRLLDALRGEDSFRGELAFTSFQGKPLHVELSAFPIRDAQGELICYAGVGRDITARKLAEQDLERANLELKRQEAQLVHSDKMASLGMLVAGIAHEINTPIGAVNSVHNTLVRSAEKLREILEAEAPELVEGNRKLQAALRAIDEANRIIHSGTERVTTIVRRLKSFARLDEAQLKRVDIHEGIEDTLTIIHHELKHKVQVERDFGQVPPLACYPGQLNQVFLNLFINAKQAIAECGTIRVTTRAADGKVTIDIADSGAGMSPETMQRIFDPGFTTKGVGVGTGLGLAICYQIIQDHHGEIRVASEPGQGTTFTVVLPADLERLLGVVL